jgi:hypothetical protein
VQMDSRSRRGCARHRRTPPRRARPRARARRGTSVARERASHTRPCTQVHANGSGVPAR